MFRLACALFGLALAAPSQERVDAGGVPSVVAHGEARISVPPDQVRIDIGVVTQAATAESASAQNAKQTTEMLAALKKALGSTAEVKTAGYSLQPNYRHSREGAPPTIAGYTASNTLQVTSSEPANIGKVIDAAARTGANNIQSIQFLLKDESVVRARALQQAGRSARANAEAMASAFGGKLGRILRVSDGQSHPIVPMRAEMMMRAQAASVATPIEPGGMEVAASVTIVAELLLP